MAGTSKGGRRRCGNEEGRGKITGTRKGGRKWWENKARRIGGGNYTTIQHILEGDALGGKMHAAVGVCVADRT